MTLVDIIHLARGGSVKVMAPTGSVGSHAADVGEQVAWVDEEGSIHLDGWAIFWAVTGFVFITVSSVWAAQYLARLADADLDRRFDRAGEEPGAWVKRHLDWFLPAMYVLLVISGLAALFGGMIWAITVLA